MSNPSTSILHETDGENVLEGNEIINTGGNATVNKTYYYFNMEVFKVPDIIGYIAKPFVEFIRMNLSIGADVRERDQVEISSLMEGDPSPSPVLSIADRYTRSMLGCLLGYPLYEPEPFSELSTEYLRNGVNIGDVGFVRKDGAFDFLFNICPTQNGSINPSNLPDGFCLLEHSKTRPIRSLLHNTCLVRPPVMKAESGEYICGGSEGAVLVLPEGANQEEAINEGQFEELAKLRGVEWYEYAKFRGRSISNGSLYLVTAFTKCAQWGIAVFDRPCHPGQGLMFVSHPLGWTGSSVFPIRVANPSQGNIPNQCVFLRGYKIMIRPDIFDKLPTRQRAQRLRGGGGTDILSRMKKVLSGESPLTRNTKPTVTKSDEPEVILHASFNSPPVHPSDLINAELLSQYPDAKIAITHDDVWCDLLRDNFPKLDYRILQKVARSYTSTIDEHGCVSLEKNVPDESNHSLREIKALSMARSDWPGISMRTGGRNRQADQFGGVDPNLPIPTEAQTVAIERPSISFFQGSSNVQISNTKFTAIGGDATIIRFGDGQFTEIQRNMICDYIANLTVLPDINDKLRKHFLTPSILSLPRANAVFNDYQTQKKSGPCFEGTRVVLLREMADWATDPDESRMYVLSGLAGIGKSTVAYTIASRAADLNLLGASFFFSRDEADRSNAKKIFSTIAYQLCVYDETFSKAIGDVLLTEHGAAATTRDPQTQLQVLILDPLWSIVQSRARPILIVVDGLDECDEEDGLSVLTGLKQLVRALPLFKVILTTRPQPRLDRFFGSQDGHKIFHLQDIEDKVVDSDIQLYLHHRLSLENVQEHLPTSQWCASDKEVDALVRAAGRLFIIASTVVRIILDKVASNPAAQMQRLLGTFAQDRLPFKDLNEFYTVILRNIVPADCDVDIVNRYQSIVGAIIFVQRPLPILTLAHLIDIDVEEIRVVLVNLRSVIILGDGDIPRIYHRSFPAYITDSKLCQDIQLHIDPMMCHTQIATRCFEIMDKHLRRNILGLGDPARFMSNEDGLKADGITDEQIQEKIPQHLQYACAYWVNHLEVANMEDEALVNGLERFAYEHILYWLEVLSLIGKLDLAHRAIGVVLKLPTSISLDLCQLLSDASRFISKFYKLIEQSALHTYYSALPFAPSDSLLYHRYIKDAEHNICHIVGDGGNVNLWDIRGIDTSSPPLKEAAAVTAMALSRDCSQLACVFEDGTVELWETSPTKRRIASHQSRTRLVPAVGLCPDGRLLAYGSDDGTIKLWNGRDGALRGTLTVTVPSGLQAVALSNSVLVAAGNGVVTLWSLDTLTRIHAFKEYGDKVSIAENSALIAISRNRDVSLLDVVNRTTIATFHVPFDIHTMTFLPDNAQVVVQSNEGIFQSLHLINRRITEGPTLEHLIQLRTTPLWHGVPIWHCQDKEQHYLAGLFSQHRNPVPILWIPKDLPVTAFTQGSSMIALGCKDGRVILLRLPTNHVS